MRHRILLFVASCFLGGLGAVLGSILGNAAGKTGLFAALIATQTLSSPIGPVLSTSLIGLGALMGARNHRDHGQPG